MSKYSRPIRLRLWSQLATMYFLPSHVAVRAGPHAVAGLAGDDQLVAGHLADDLPADDLGVAGRSAVVVGEVEVGDAEVEGAEQAGAGDVRAAVAAEGLPAAERDRRQQESAASTAPVLHPAVVAAWVEWAFQPGGDSGRGEREGLFRSRHSVLLSHTWGHTYIIGAKSVGDDLDPWPLPLQGRGTQGTRCEEVPLPGSGKGD